MKIVCDACSAKYSIADEKVKGKVFKIRCKKCSNIIVVRGNAGGEEPAPLGAVGGFDQKETRVYDYSGYDGEAGGAPPVDEPVWHIVVNQEQVGPITIADVQSRFASGEIDADTYIWREGFPDWLPLSQVPEFVALTSGGAAEAPPPGSSGKEAVANMFGAANYDEGTARSDPNDVFAAHAAKVADAPEAPDADDGASDLFAARTAAKAPATGDGLFGGASSSGKAAASGGDSATGLKGQRGENSVLFSLNNLAALASDGPKSAAPSATGAGSAQLGGGEGSGLIDIRSMASAYLHQGQKPGAAKPGGNIGSIDDLPVFSTASFSEPAAIIPQIGASRASNKMLYLLAAAVAALAVIAIVLVLVVLKQDSPAPVVASAGNGVVGAGSGSQVAVADKPVAEPPVTDKPVAEPPVTDKPVAEPPVTDKPVAEPPVPDKPVIGRDKKPTDKPTRPTRPPPEKGDKPDKPVPEKPVKEVAAAGGCDEVSCLLAEGKPSACCARLKGGGGGESKPAKVDPNLPEKLVEDDIRNGVKKVSASVMGCGGRSSAKGTVKVGVKVSASGSVSSVTVKETPDPALGSCVAAAMKKATFPKTQGGGSFSYPFTFR